MEIVHVCVSLDVGTILCISIMPKGLTHSCKPFLYCMMQLYLPIICYSNADVVLLQSDAHLQHIMEDFSNINTTGEVTYRCTCYTLFLCTYSTYSRHYVH